MVDFDHAGADCERRVCDHLAGKAAECIRQKLGSCSFLYFPGSGLHYYVDSLGLLQQDAIRA